ncbi:MAG: hypothetical protein ACKV2V_05875, partial [Blastocatellia bacterium]
MTAFAASPIFRRGPVATAAAATINVPGNFPTIQQAVNAAAPGDTIVVAAGGYVGPVNVNKSLTIGGANSGVAGTAARGPESILSGGGFTISASNVVINGFTVQNEVNGAGVTIAAGTSGVQVINNIIQNNVIGVYPQGTGPVISNNLIRNNTQPGGASGSGVYIGESSLTGATFNANRFEGNPTAAINLTGGFGCPSVPPITHTGIVITNNQIIAEAGIGLAHTNGATISG